jgi:hypothetical protein
MRGQPEAALMSLLSSNITTNLLFVGVLEMRAVPRRAARLEEKVEFLF